MARRLGIVGLIILTVAVIVFIILIERAAASGTLAETLDSTDETSSTMVGKSLYR
jgi:flagellar biosynthesis/type III secretory pathway M-ring protein FliF/YscJ